MTKRIARKRSVPAEKRLADPSNAVCPGDYSKVLGDIKRLIADSRRRALSIVNRELLLVYWQIGAVIVRQQEDAQWGDGVVVQLAADLRAAFPDMKGLSRSNVFQMRQWIRSCREIDDWLRNTAKPQEPESKQIPTPTPKVSAPSGLSKGDDGPVEKVQTLSGLMELGSSDLAELIPAISWSHHAAILTRCESPAERYFYMKMAVRERWSVRELRRQIDSALFARYATVRDEPERCLPTEFESGALLPFKDQYVLEFLGLSEAHTERELRQAILANLRDFFLEFGKDLTFVGEEYPVTVGGDTFSIDLLFFHRRLQCLIVIELKKGKFKPEYAGKSRFYCAALDEFIKLPHENPTLGLVLCRSADAVQVRLALTDAAEKIGVATYQTALPDEQTIRQRIEQLPELPEPSGQEPHCQEEDE